MGHILQRIGHGLSNAWHSFTRNPLQDIGDAVAYYYGGPFGAALADTAGNVAGLSKPKYQNLGNAILGGARVGLGAYSAGQAYDAAGNLINAGSAGATSAAATPGSATSSFLARTGAAAPVEQATPSWAAPSAADAATTTAAGTAAGAAAPAALPYVNLPSGAATAATTGTAAASPSIYQQAVNYLTQPGTLTKLAPLAIQAYGASQAPQVNTSQLTALNQQAAQLEAAAQSGTITPSQQAELAQIKASQEAAARQSLASAGIGGGTPYLGSEQQIQTNALALQQQLANQNLQSGLQALGYESGNVGAQINTNLLQNEQYQQALRNYAATMGGFAAWQ